MRRVVEKKLTIIQLMIIVAVIGIVASVAIPAVEDAMVRAKVREALDLADPARTALGIACSEGSLAGKDNRSLGLPPASAGSGDYTRSIVAEGRSASEGIVTITFASIGRAIEDGQRIVHTGACGPGGMRWTMTGDVQPKYRPNT